VTVSIEADGCIKPGKKSLGVPINVNITKKTRICHLQFSKNLNVKFEVLADNCSVLDFTFNKESKTSHLPRSL